MYDRFRPTNELLKFSDFNVNGFELLFSYRFFLFNEEYVKNIYMDEAALIISPILGTSALDKLYINLLDIFKNYLYLIYLLFHSFMNNLKEK